MENFIFLSNDYNGDHHAECLKLIIKKKQITSFLLFGLNSEIYGIQSSVFIFQIEQLFAFQLIAKLIEDNVNLQRLELSGVLIKTEMRNLTHL